MTDPTFSRIEIRLNDKADLETARRELLDLAADLRIIIKAGHEDEVALVLARHKIKTTSQKLRMGISNATA